MILRPGHSRDRRIGPDKATALQIGPKLCRNGRSECRQIFRNLDRGVGTGNDRDGAGMAQGKLQRRRPQGDIVLLAQGLDPLRLCQRVLGDRLISGVQSRVAAAQVLVRKQT